MALDRTDLVRRGDDDPGAGPAHLSDHVIASAVLVRDTTTGANLAADGSDSERFIARSGDACFDHLLCADHGFFTVDRTTGCG